MAVRSRLRLRWGAGLAVGSLLVVQSASLGIATAAVAPPPSTCAPSTPGSVTSTPTTPAIGIGSASTPEGDHGNRKLWFAVTLSQVSANPVTVCYQTNGVTATAGEDFTQKAGTLTIAPGSTSASIPVAIDGDRIQEPDETFTVDLTSPVGAHIIRSSGTGTVANDDVAGGRRLAIGSASVLEGAEGSRQIRFAVTLSRASTTPVTVAYATSSRSALAGSDFKAAMGTLTIPAGSTSVALPISVKGDGSTEPNETFRVRLSAPVGATLTAPKATGTILEDEDLDAPPVHEPPDFALDPVFVTQCPTSITWTAHVEDVPGQAILVVLDRSNERRSWTPAEHAGTVSGEFTGLGLDVPHQAVITRYVNSVVQEHHDIDIAPNRGCGL